MIQFSYLYREMETGVRLFKWASLKMTLFLGVVLALTQCKPDTGKNTADELVEIDVTKNYPRKEFYLQDIAHVEYIPLETNNNTLMRFREDAVVHVSDDYIIAQNYNEGDIFVFDGQGKSKFSFNHKGQGPSEYNVLWNMAFDEKAKEIFVSDLSNPKIHVYDVEGKYKRTLAVSSDLHDFNLYNFDDETLLVYDKTGVFGQGIDDRGYVNKPYLRMSKNDGSIVDSLNIQLPVRLSNAAVWQVGQDGGELQISAMSISIINNRSYGKNFLIADWSADTIYRLTLQNELQPMIVRKPPMQNTDPKIIISNTLITDRFILLGIHAMDYDAIKKGNDISQKQLMYDFTTGETNAYRLKNKDITSSADIMFYSAMTPENTGITIYNTGSLLELDEKGEIRGELKEVLKSLDYEDNPVLMKVKF